MIDHWSNFSKLMQEDPFLARMYATLDPNTQSWYNQNLHRIGSTFFGGTQPQNMNEWATRGNAGMNRWINSNSAGGDVWNQRGGNAFVGSDPHKRLLGMLKGTTTTTPGGPMPPPEATPRIPELNMLTQIPPPLAAEYRTRLPNGRMRPPGGPGGLPQPPISRQPPTPFNAGNRMFTGGSQGFDFRGGSPRQPIQRTNTALTGALNERILP